MASSTSDLNVPITDAVVIHEDNQSAIAIAKNPQFHGRIKHIDIKYHFVREHVKVNSIELKYCSTDEMLADLFTKGLNFDKFAKFRFMIGVRVLD